LGLGPAQRLLDIGCGRGWPGIYLAHQNGCQAVFDSDTHGLLETKGFPSLL